MERRLTAIFSTDVKGYSRLMGDDEEATIHTIKAYLRLTKKEEAMKNTLILTALAFVLTLGFAGEGRADVPPDHSDVLLLAQAGNSQCSSMCDDLANLGLNHRECTSFCQSCLNNGNTDALCSCNLLEAVGMLNDFFKNFGQCVKAVWFR